MSNQNQIPNNTLWGPLALSEKQSVHSIGNINLHFIQTGYELQIAVSYADQEPIYDEKALSWVRFISKDRLEGLNVMPAMPDRPLVVKPETPFFLNIGAKIKAFIRIPVWVSLTSLVKGESELRAFASVTLSSTWFGSPEDGELCYWLSSSARAQIDPDLSRPHMAICSVVLSNQSNDILPVEKFLVRAENCTLFTHEEALWTDEISITYKGRDEISRVSYSGKAPAALPGAHKIADAKASGNRTFFAKSFDLATGGLF